MTTAQPGFWDVQERLRELSAQGDPLEKLAATVDFELSRADLINPDSCEICWLRRGAV